MGFSQLRQFCDAFRATFFSKSGARRSVSVDTFSALPIRSFLQYGKAFDVARSISVATTCTRLKFLLFYQLLPTYFDLEVLLVEDPVEHIRSHRKQTQHV